MLVSTTNTFVSVRVQRYEHIDNRVEVLTINLYMILDVRPAVATWERLIHIITHTCNCIHNTRLYLGYLNH